MCAQALGATHATEGDWAIVLTNPIIGARCPGRLSSILRVVQQKVEIG